MKKKLLSLLLAAVMLLSLLPAAQATEPVSGSCGENAVWSYDNGILTITGTGPMDDFLGPAPWNAYKDELWRVNIEQGITHIGAFAFNGYPSLSNVNMPITLESVGDLAFFGCTNLTSAELYSGVTRIGHSAFGETGLLTAIIPDTVTWIGNAAFASCPSLGSVKLPSGLVKAEGSVFRDCEALWEVIMPNMPNLEGFGAMFFHNCDSLTDISFYTAPFIDGNMFADCDGLTDITIPVGVTALGEKDYSFAFSGCANLKTVTIHPGVEVVGNCSFDDCPALETVTFQGKAPVFGDAAFQGTTVTCYYPANNPTWTEDVLQNYGGTVTWVPFTEPTSPFADVKTTDYFFEPVLWAVEHNITAGTGNGNFSPNQTCTRAQVVTFLWRAKGCPAPSSRDNPFTDVAEGDYYYDAVLWAVEHNITAGMSATTFAPNDPCTRAQVVTFLWRTMGQPEPEMSDNPFTDVAADAWFYAPVLWAVEHNITAGMSPTSFAPNNPCIRGQVVTFLFRTFAD